MKRSLVCALLLGLSIAGAAAGQARLWQKPGPCDRDCLKGIVDECVGAMVARDPHAAPLADKIKFTENTETLPVGQGLWAGATGASKTYRIYVPDPVSEQVGFMGLIQTGDKFNQLALRLKVESGKITEAEHYVARNLSDNSVANLQAPRPGLVATLPAVKRIPRELMLIIAAQFRHEFKTKDIQVVDRDGNVTTRHMDYGPFDFRAVHITKISDYRIHEQEAMGYRMPYMSSNGWSRFLR